MGVTMSCGKSDEPESRPSSNDNISSTKNKKIYHERQSRELCALHTLNNLFQEKKTFTKKDLDDICVRLSPNSYVNPHRSMIALGNYDVNVIMAALQTKNFDTVWFDKRRDIENLQFSNIFGFILNVPTDFKWGYFKLPIQRKHWIGVKKINNVYYNLDSKLDAPEIVGSESELKIYLTEQILSKDKELLIVVNQDISSSMLWKEESTVHKMSSGGESNADSGVCSQGSPVHDNKS